MSVLSELVGVNCLKDESGNIVVKLEMIKKRWREYMEQLLNVENDWDGIVECGIVEGPREFITEMEVEKAIGQMKSRRAGGPVVQWNWWVRLSMQLVK